MFIRFVTLLMFLVTPFTQAQAVLECAMMDLQTAVRCSCTGDHQPSMKMRGTNIPCCAIDIKAGEQEFVTSTAESSSQLTAKGSFNHASVAATLSTAPYFVAVAIGV